MISGRYWEMVQRLKVNQLYLAPTALRLLLKYDDHYVTQYDRSSLRTLGCGGLIKSIRLRDLESYEIIVFF